MVVDIPDTVTYTNFGDHQLRGFWVAGVKFPPLPLTFIVALTTLSHYRVIGPLAARNRRRKSVYSSKYSTDLMLIWYSSDTETNVVEGSTEPWPDLPNILQQSYNYLTIKRKLRSTYDGRLIYKTSYEGCKAFLRYD